MRQILLNSLPMHAPEKLVLVVFFSVQSRIESCSDHRQLPSCALLGQPGAAVPAQPLDGRGRRSRCGRISLAEVCVSGYDSSSPPTKY
jgi:hypothetical protein